MSVSNPAEAELRELVAKTLEEKGVLGKVKVAYSYLVLSKFPAMCICTGAVESQRLSSTSRTRFAHGNFIYGVAGV